MSSEQNRRQFLKKASVASVGALAFIPELGLARTLLRNLLYSANAEASGLGTDRYYINIMWPDAPPRITFDQWLRTNADDPAVIANPMAATAFTYNSSRDVTGLEYRTMDYNGVQIPQMFAALSSADRDSFLNQFLVIRGYGSGQDGHAFNASIQMHPLATAPSISGYLADQSTKYFKAIQSTGRGAFSRFVSHKNVSLNMLANVSNPLDTLLKALSLDNDVYTAPASSDKSRTLRAANQDLISALRSQLKNSPATDKAAAIARGNLDSVYALLQSNLGDYTAEWTARVADYKAVMETAARATNIPGIHTALDGSGSLAATSDGVAPKFNIDIGGNTSFTYGTGKNVANITGYLDMTTVAQSLALADYCIRNDLATVIELKIPSFDGILQDPDQGSSSVKISLPNDCHVCGAYPSLVATSAFYRGYIAGLLRLKERLTASNQWSNTIVQTVSDFGRTCRTNASGSDHGFNQMVSSVFSGVIQGGPYVVGNVKVGKSTGDYLGTQGEAAPIDGLGTSLTSPSHMASSVSRLMGISANPWNNIASPLIQLNPNGTLHLPFGKGKLIA